MSQSQSSQSKQRRPYKRPSVTESGRFEGLVLTCGFTPAEPACDVSSPTSVMTTPNS